MRRLLACLIAAFVVPAAARATSMPPLHGMPKAIPFVRADAQRSTTSCNVHSRSAKTRAERFANRLAPVACEQPPRAKLRNTVTPGSFLGP
jgi:hypothetical protein